MIWRRIGIVVVAVGVLLGLQQLIERTTHGFCLQRIQTADLALPKEWSSASIPTEVTPLLDQQYHLLGAGSECFAFGSEDGSAVIKFFKLDLMRPVFLHRGLFLEDYSAYAGKLSLIPQQLQHLLLGRRLFGIRDFRLLRTFTSLVVADTALKKESGLLYLHLTPTDHLRTTLTVHDGCGIAHEIDLDATPFVLQQRALSLQSHFAHLRSAKDEEGGKRSIDSLLALLEARCHKGFADRDIVARNFGFIGHDAIEIDSGSFLPCKEMRQAWLYKQELFYAALELKRWLKKSYPELRPYVDQRIETWRQP